VPGIEDTPRSMRGKNITPPSRTSCSTTARSLTPAARFRPAPKGLGSTGNPVFCSFWTYLGVPAVTLPLLEVDGLPMGVQLIGARRDDGRLLRTAQQLARRLEPANA
jgi:Asp-tRNA(Asn)/Glu-tRNA(Gln) amidotransferase A subunit family amidase